MDGTVVDFLYEPNGPTPFKCGYCKSPDTSMIQGVLAHRMTCQDYQYLVDRGFQRSGRFVYRPYMKQTCCPQYVFRTDITKFRQSKQHRATVKKMNKYLVEGRSYTLPQMEGLSERGHATVKEAGSSESRPGSELVVGGASGSETTRNHPSTSEGTAEGGTETKQTRRKTVRPGLGADPSKPPCKKAKLIRMERNAKKMAEKGHKMEHPEATAAKPGNPSTSSSQHSSSSTVAEWQEDKNAIPSAPSNAHTFSTRLVCCAPRDGLFITTFDESYQVFKKFQMGVHKEELEDCRERHFNEFLVESPLIKEKAPEGAPCDYGSYHLQYLIDGKIFAVGVLDVLPKGVLCEYLYYDPYYRFITPGVYTALYEMCLAQKFYKVNPQMEFYYMGFYVQSCPKMNYKRHYSFSELLCPETYQYVALPTCIPILKESEYSCLDNDAPEPEDDKFTKEIIDNLKILSNMEVLTYETYCTLNGDSREGMVTAYAQLMGKAVAKRSTLHIGEPMIPL